MVSTMEFLQNGSELEFRQKRSGSLLQEVEIGM